MVEDVLVVVGGEAEEAVAGDLESADNSGEMVYPEDLALVFFPGYFLLVLLRERF